MYENIVKVTEYASYKTEDINKLLDKGWIILNTFQYTDPYDKESYGRVLLGLPKEFIHTP